MSPTELVARARTLVDRFSKGFAQTPIPIFQRYSLKICSCVSQRENVGRIRLAIEINSNASFETEKANPQTIHELIIENEVILSKSDILDDH